MPAGPKSTAVANFCRHVKTGNRSFAGVHRVVFISQASLKEMVNTSL